MAVFGSLIAEALPRLQAAAEARMTERCDIGDVTTTTDDNGFTVTVLDPVLSDVPCRIQTYNPYEQAPEVGSGTRVVQRYSLHIPVSSLGVKVGHLARITAGVSVGREFRIGGLNRKTDQTAQRLLVDEQTGGIQ